MPTAPHSSVDDQPILAESVETSRRLAKGPWLAGIVALLMVGTVLVLGSVWLVPQEMQRWRLAAAEELRLNGDLTGALLALNHEIQIEPGNPNLRLRRAEWLTENEQYPQALAEVNEILRQHPGDVRAYFLRAQVHQSMGEFAQAVADWKMILSFDAVSSGSTRAGALNGLAYAQSLANIEIDQGLALVDEAMRLRGEDYAMLDTRGFLYYRQGDWDRALSDLDNAVEFAEAEYARLAVASPVIADRRLKREQDRQQSQTLAVIRYHRSLVHDSLHDTEKAQADRRRVRELGFEPGDRLF